MNYFKMVGSGVLFGLWPLLFKRAGFSAEWAMLLPGLGNVLVGLAMLLRSGGGTAPATVTGWGLGLLAAVLTNVGLVAFTSLTASPDAEVRSLTMVVVSTVQVVSGGFFAWCLFPEATFAPSKLVGLGIIAVGLWVFQK